MKLASSLVISAALFCGPLVSPSAPAQARPEECVTTVVFQVDGTKGPGTPTSVDPESPLNRIANRYRAQSDTRVVDVAYPGTVVPIEPWGALPYDESVAQGLKILDRKFRDVEKMCPGTYYVFLGYSQGARVAGDFLEYIDRGDYGDDIAPYVRGELYSDPREGIEAYLPGKIAPGITFVGPRPAWTRVRVASTCLLGDPICGYRPGDNPAEALKGYVMHHTQYGK